MTQPQQMSFGTCHIPDELILGDSGQDVWKHHFYSITDTQTTLTGFSVY